MTETSRPTPRTSPQSTLRVRSERNAQGNGRVSLIVTTATDTAGNKAHCCATVVVPRNQSAAAIASVNAQAAAARAFCAANNGAAPAGFVKVGIGPVIGPIQ